MGLQSQSQYGGRNCATFKLCTRKYLANDK